MLIGQYRVKISPKGRTSVPKKFREVLGKTLVLTVGYENSLMLVSSEDWQGIFKAAEDKPLVLGTARDTKRFLLGEASEIEIDDQGRFIIPGYLRDYAKIGEEVVFLGLNKYVEIWDKGLWDSYQKNLNNNIGEIGEKLSQFNEVDK